jgi:vacuolar-type H+-ATPase subunit B/Vma2
VNGSPLNPVKREYPRNYIRTGDPDLKTMKESLDIGAVAIFGGVLFLSRKRKINPIMLMLVSGAAGIILYM